MSIFKYKAFNERKDKILLSVTAIAVSLYMAFSCTYFTASAETVKEDVVRLHILANSNSKADQEVKLKVRDALLKTNASILSDSVTKENAKEHFEKSVKKTLTIPSWLNDVAMEKNINFSQVLQEALLTKIRA